LVWEEIVAKVGYQVKKQLKQVIVVALKATSPMLKIGTLSTVHVVAVPKPNLHQVFLLSFFLCAMYIFTGT
jgi:hypothetical protein